MIMSREDSLKNWLVILHPSWCRRFLNKVSTKTKKSFLIPTCQQQACDFKAAESSAKNKRPFLAQNVAPPTFNCHAHLKYLRQNLTQFFLPSKQSSSEALPKGGNFIWFLPVLKQCSMSPHCCLTIFDVSTLRRIQKCLVVLVWWLCQEQVWKGWHPGWQFCHAAVKTDMSNSSPVLLLLLL